MPFFTFYTTIPASKIPCDFAKKTRDILVKTMKRTAEKYVIHISPDQIIHWGLDDDDPKVVPRASVIIKRFGHLEIAENRLVTSELYTLFEKELGLRKDRIKILFEDLNKVNVAVRGEIVADAKN